MGLLNTIETLLSVMEEQPQIMSQLEPIVLQVVAHIFGRNVTGMSFHISTFMYTRLAINHYCDKKRQNTCKIYYLLKI